MENILNFRCLAEDLINKNGKSIKENTIFRSALPRRASKNDVDTFNNLNIKYIYDLRSNDELSKDGEVIIEGIQVSNYNIVKQVASQNDMAKLLSASKDDVDNFMIGLYENELFEARAYKELLHNILKQDTPQFLFNCTAGKDRTGVLGALLMMILDFSYEDIVIEYLRIDSRLAEALLFNFSEKHDVPDETLENLEGLMLVKSIYIEKFLEKVLNNYGSFDDYLNEFYGINSEIKLEFQRLYLK